MYGTSTEVREIFLTRAMIQKSGTELVAWSPKKQTTSSVHGNASSAAWTVHFANRCFAECVTRWLSDCFFYHQSSHSVSIHRATHSQVSLSLFDVECRVRLDYVWNFIVGWPWKKHYCWIAAWVRGNTFQILQWIHNLLAHRSSGILFLSHSWFRTHCVCFIEFIELHQRLLVGVVLDLSVGVSDCIIRSLEFVSAVNINLVVVTNTKCDAKQLETPT